MAAFAELGIMPEIIRSIEEQGWMLPTPIQAEAVPLILGLGDVMGAAETGSGKTGAFGIPILQLVHEALQKGEGTDEAAAAAAASGKPVASAASEAVAMSSEDKEAMFSVSSTGLECRVDSSKAWAGGRSNVGLHGSGKFYFEVECVSVAGTVRVGFSTMAASHTLGSCGNGFGYGGTAKRSNNGQFIDYGEVYSEGDVVGCFIDLAAGSISFSVNGEDQGQAFSIPNHMKKSAFYPAVCLKNAAVSVNFGGACTQFAFPAPGFRGVAEAKDNEKRYSDMGGEDGGGGGAGGGATPLCIILEPSRDLAEQTYKCLEDFRKYITTPRVHCCLIVGGVDMGQQVKQLKSGVHVVIGTPGRVEDLMKAGKLSVRRCRHFVLDEADRLLETGNLATITKIHSALVKSQAGDRRLQTLMFSATLHSPEIRGLAEKIAQHPMWVDLKGKDHVPQTVHHLVVDIDPVKDTSWGNAPGNMPTDEIHIKDVQSGGVKPSNPSPNSRSEGIKRLKLLTLVRLVNKLKMDQCMIFCRTNFDCDNLEKYLNSLGGGKAFRGKMEKGVENPYSCVVLAGWRSVEERRQNLQSFKDGDVRFLICTDLAARGIDISGLPFVVNVTLPDSKENYVHRIGRVGRAEKMGLAISLVATEKERVWFCQKGTKGRGPGGRAPPCDDTRDYEKGGNCVWYDERALIKDVETLLGKEIERIPPTLEIRKEVLEMKFGEEKDSALSEQSKLHVQELRPTVLKLAQIERQAQTSFHRLQHRWNVKT